MTKIVQNVNTSNSKRCLMQALLIKDICQVDLLNRRYFFTLTLLGEKLFIIAIVQLYPQSMFLKYNIFNLWFQYTCLKRELSKYSCLLYIILFMQFFMITVLHIQHQLYRKHYPYSWYWILEHAVMMALIPALYYVSNNSQAMSGASSGPPALTHTHAFLNQSARTDYQTNSPQHLLQQLPTSPTLKPG